MHSIFTVGHSTHTLDTFAALLRTRHIGPDGELAEHAPPPFAAPQEDGTVLYPPPAALFEVTQAAASVAERCCWGLIPRMRLNAVLRANGLP